MTTRFENPPVLEVIAEFRWNTAQDALFQQVFPGVPIQMPDDMGISTERFMERFGRRADDAGFRSSERLFPQGTPLMPGQAAMRYRRRAGEPPLMQAGTGLVTVNGLPPTYSHWGDFAPTVRIGVEAMLECRDDTEKELPVTSTLRYVNAFRGEFLEGSDPGRFISDVLGFKLNLPDRLQGQLHAARPISLAQQLNVPLADESNLIISVGEGLAENQQAVILELVSQKADLLPDTDAIMDTLWSGHTQLRELFTEMTRPIAQLMRPVEVDE